MLMLIFMNEIERLKEIYLAAACRRSRQICRQLLMNDKRELKGSRKTRFRTLKRVESWKQK